MILRLENNQPTWVTFGNKIQEGNFQRYLQLYTLVIRSCPLNAPKEGDASHSNDDTIGIYHGITRILLAGQSPSLTPEPSGISVLFFSAGVAGVNMLADNLSTLRLSRLPVNISTGLSTDPTVIKTSKNPSNIT